MATTTTNYGFSKPASTDTTVVRTTYAAALDAIDTAIKGVADARELTTRSFFVPARPATIVDGALNTSDGSAPAITVCVQLDDAATEGSYFTAMVPADATAAQPLSAAIYWYPDATDAAAHSVQWRLNALALPTTTNVTAAGTTTTFTGVSQANTTKLMVIESAQQILASVSATNAFRFSVYRLGADAADTYVGAVNLVGVRFDYVSRF